MSTTATAKSIETPAAETAVMDLARIRPPSSNVREDFGDVEGLAQTIGQTGGLLQNLVVFRVDDGDVDHDAELIAGERRYRAAQLAGCKSVPVTIRPRPSERERLELQLIENVDRLDLSTHEVFHAVQGLLDLGVTDAELAGTVGRSPDEAATLRGIVRLGPAVHDLIAAGDLSLSEAAPLTELADAGDEYIEYAVRCMHQGFDPAAAVRQTKAKQRQDQVVTEASALAEKRKLRLIERPRYGSFDDGTTKRLGTGVSCLNLPVKQHSKLPCHAAYIDTDASNARTAIVPVCTDAKSHRPTSTPVIGGGTTSGQLTPAQKAVATKRHRKAWRETHAPRAAAVTRVVGGLSIEDAMERVAWHVLQDRDFSDHAYLGAARLLVGPDNVPDGIVATRNLVLNQARQGGEATLRVALAMVTSRSEYAFQQPRGVYPERFNVRDHFRMLAAHDYELGDAELDHLRDEYSLKSLSTRLHADPGGYGQARYEPIGDDSVATDGETGTYEDLDDDLADDTAVGAAA